MMRKVMLGVGVAALMLAGCAGTSEAKKDVEGAVAGLEETKEGTIVDVQQDFIAVQDAEDPQGEPLRFQRTETTDLVRDEEPFSWPQLAPGMPVRVSYEAEAGAEQASRIEILTGSEADEVRSKTSGSTGWQKPEGMTRPRGEGGPPPADMPGAAQPNGTMEMPSDDMDGGAMDEDESY